jgi:hypothetical protein
MVDPLQYTVSGRPSLPYGMTSANGGDELEPSHRKSLWITFMHCVTESVTLDL